MQRTERSAGAKDNQVSGGGEEPRLLVQRAFRDATAGAEAAHVHGLARRALHGSPLLHDGPAGVAAHCVGAMALVLVDELAAGEQALTQAVQSARRRRLKSVLVMACHLRAIAHLRRGRAADAVIDSQAGLKVMPAQPPPAGLHGVMADALLELDEPVEATRQVVQGMSSGAVGDEVSRAFVLAGRARLRSLSNEPRPAIADYFEAGGQLARVGADSPRLLPWRSPAAVSLAHTGHPMAARRLVTEELELAEACGDPGAIGRALHALGLVEPVPRAVGRMREAVALLRRSERALDRMRALADLGAALRRMGAPEEARDPLREALDLAERSGARKLATRAWAELAAAGGRPRRAAAHGLDALTPREREIARLAADGRGAHDIASGLFITRKTVEWHIGHIYEKLDVRSRRELAVVLASGPQAD